MSRLPDEPRSWLTEADGDAALGNLRQQIADARLRLGQQWSHIRARETALDSVPESDEARD